MHRNISGSRTSLRIWCVSALVGAVTSTLIAVGAGGALAAVPTSAPSATVMDGEPSTITGRVTNNRVPIEQLTVGAYLPGATEAPAGEAEPPVSWVTTNAEGRFTLTVPAGDYQIRVYDQRRFYRDQWVGTDGTGTRAAATVVNAPADGIVTVDVTTVAPLRTVGIGYGTGGELWARRWDESGQSWGELYQLTDRAMFGWVIEPGRYRFLRYGVGLPTWYGDTLDFEQAKDVVVTEDGDPNTSLSFDTIYAQSVTALEPVELLGSGWVGEPLTFRDAAWNVAPEMWSHQIVRDDGKVLVDNGPWGYTPGPADAGHTIELRMTASRAGYNSGRSVSAPVRIEALQATTAPTVAGKWRLGSILRASAGMWNHPVAGHTYQWTRSGRPVAGAEQSTYKLGRADLGKKIAVQVKAATAEGRSGTAQSAAVRVPAGASFTVTRSTFQRAGHTLTRFRATLHLVGADHVRGRFSVTGPQMRSKRSSYDGAAVSWTTPAKPGRYAYRLELRGSDVVTPAETAVSATVRAVSTHAS